MGAMISCLLTECDSASIMNAVLQTACAVGLGLVITVVYLTRRRKKNGKSGTENNSNHNSILTTKAAIITQHAPLISDETNSHTNHQTESEEDLRREIQECRTLVTSLEREIDFERRKKNEAESFCSALEKELQSERKARQISDIKYEKLLKRYDVISVKLKAAEERCKKLVEELNNESGMDAAYDSLEDDDDDEDVDDNDISYDETPPLSPEIEAVRAAQLKAVGNKTPEFELEMNVMEALVGAVMDYEEEDGENNGEKDCDTDSLTDLLLNNMSEDDLQENTNGDENLNNTLNSLAEEALIYDAMQTVNSTEKLWEQFSGSDRSCVNCNGEQEDGKFVLHDDETATSNDVETFARSSPFSELQRRWHSQTIAKSNSNSDEITNNNDKNTSQNIRTLEDYVKEDGGEESVIKVGHLKQQWENLTRTDDN